MPSTTPEEAGVVCDRIRDEISKVQWPAHPERTITVSIGIAGATESVEITPENWLEETDKTLYRAKKGGRNRVITTDIGTGQSIELAKAG